MVIVDTAGRLHTKLNLMKELEKMHRLAAKRVPGAPHDVYLIIDATTGQNGLVQAREFLKTSGVTGLIVTKLDGTAKGASSWPSPASSGCPSATWAWARRWRTSSTSAPRTSSNPSSPLSLFSNPA